MANIPLQSISFPGLSDKYTTPVVDNTLTQTGAAADAKKTGDEIGAIKNDFTQLEAKVEDAYNAYVTETETGSIASFTDGADDVPVKDLTVAIEPVQSGSGDPSPSNVRPISGWTGANVTRTGKNLLKNEKTTETIYGVTFTVNNDGSISLSGTATQNINYIMRTGEYAFPNGTFTLSGCPSGGSASTYYLRLDTSTGQIKALDTGSGAQYTVTDGKSHVVYISVKSGVNVDGLVFRPQIEFGSTATDYEPYQADTVSVDWTTEAGTVYGGTLDVTTGVLTVTNWHTDLGTLNWSRDATHGYFLNRYNVSPNEYIKTPALNTDYANLVCSKYVRNTATNIINNSGSGIGCTNDGYLIIGDTNYTDPTTFKESLSGVQLVYELLTQKTYQFTPEEVKTVLGQNNIFADCGDATVQYRADTKLYIDKVLNA